MLVNVVLDMLVLDELAGIGRCTTVYRGEFEFARVGTPISGWPWTWTWEREYDTDTRSVMMVGDS